MSYKQQHYKVCQNNKYKCVLLKGWEEWGHFNFFLGRVVKPLGYWSGEKFFRTGCDSGLLGWYVMFCEGQYVVESRANCLGRADMQVRSHFCL
jgi:hypothetical protein